jgi:hypothetical protein
MRTESVAVQCESLRYASINCFVILPNVQVKQVCEVSYAAIHVPILLRTYDTVLTGRESVDGKRYSAGNGSAVISGQSNSSLA